MIHLIDRNPDALIDYLDSDCATVSSGRNENLSPIRGVFDGVLEEITQNLGQQCGITLGGW
jgi:hypothetical protein